MKFNKKWTAATAFILGAVILTTSALADVGAGSGYKKLKQSVKDTCAFVSDVADSYSVDYSVNFKWKDTTLTSAYETMKRDTVNNRSEQISKNFDISREEGSREYSYHYYNDANMSMCVYPGGEVSVNQYSTVQKDVAKEQNPFEEEYMADIENLVDAFAGSLTDTVQTEENGDKTMYIADIETTQIPAYLNAMVAFFAKQMMNNYNSFDDLPSPEIKSDVYVKSASGKAVSDENGILTSVVAQGVVMGKDANGEENQFSLEISYRMYDINKTVIEIPEIPEGADIIKTDNSAPARYGFNEKTVGVYKRDIVDTKGDMPVKIGERELSITAVTDECVIGHYREIYTDGSGENLDFDFEAKAENNINLGRQMFITYEKDGEERFIGIHGDSQGLFCTMDLYDKIKKDSVVSEYLELIRVFE